MNASQLTKIIAKETGEPAYKVNKILSATIKVIRQQIIKAQIIKLKNLLTIFIDVAPERVYYNVYEKKNKKLPRRFVLKVEPSKRLKEEIDAKKTY
jgi:nucleoid DNA-binding protein